MCKYYFIWKINRIKRNQKNERNYSQEEYVENIDMRILVFWHSNLSELKALKYTVI